MNEKVNQRRRFLTIATSAIGGAGLAAASIPFIQSWLPSDRARASAAPVSFDFSKLENGAMATVAWQGKPVWVLRRTRGNLEKLAEGTHRQRLVDPDSGVNQQPDYARNEFRSRRPDVLVAVGICTHLGCVPSYVPLGTAGVNHSLFFCPCHNSKFDLAGRVFKNVPAPTNLIIPPYRFTDRNIVEIGVDETTNVQV